MRHWRFLSLLLIIGLFVVFLAGCGGGGGKSASITGPTGGGGSTAVIQGQVLSSGRTAAREPAIVVVLETVLGIGVAEAQDAVPVPGATVLLQSSGATVATTTTDADGKFIFQSVAPGTYTIVVQVGGATVGETEVVVGAGDSATVKGEVTQVGVTFSIDVDVIDVTSITENPAQLGHAINLASAKLGANCSATTPPAGCETLLDEIIDDRLAGLGWGEIAHKLGVHPGFLGLGRSNVSDAAIDSASSKAKGKGKGRGRKS